MSILKLILREIGHRKTHFALSWLAATVAVTLFVAGPTLLDGYARQSDRILEGMEAEVRASSEAFWKRTTRIMRDMGFNLLIVHKDTNMGEFWSRDFSTIDMPEEYVQRLANAETLTLATHIVATLQEKIDWNQRKVLLVGYAREATQPHRDPKTPMGYAIESGTVYLGHELGLVHEEGETVEVRGQEFRVARILPERGSKEDITIAMSLEDAQKVLGKPGKVNQILALGCRCEGARLPLVRKQLEEVLPETKITEFQSIALARAEQRNLVEKQNRERIEQARQKRASVRTTMETLDAVTTPLVVLACAVWIGLLALANVRERRSEIGLLRALGTGSWRIGALFLGKAALIGLLAAVVGFPLGTLVAHQLGLRALEVPSEVFRPALDLLVASLLGAPLLSAMASYLPTLSAVLQDPALVLREE